MKNPITLDLPFPLRFALLFTWVLYLRPHSHTPGLNPFIPAPFPALSLIISSPVYNLSPLFQEFWFPTSPQVVHGFLSDLGDHQLLISVARVFRRRFGLQFLMNNWNSSFNVKVGEGGM